MRDTWKFPAAGMTLSIMVVSIVGCSTVPPKYLNQAERGVTLTEVTADPARYQGKVVILGGALLGEERRDGHYWLHLRNRPLDNDNRPHLPGERDMRKAEPVDGITDIGLVPEIPLLRGAHS